MSFFYGILSVIGWSWCLVVAKYLEREIVRGALR
jgi:hypothetical protein